MKQALILLTFLVWMPLQAAVEVLSFDTPQQEEDYKKLISELRCLVCQNQNLADSNADLAKDLRRQTYEMVAQGQTKQEIADYMVQRYGDFVLYRPPLRIKTVLLWVGPALFLLAGFLMLRHIIKDKTTSSVPDENSLKRARALLNDDEDASI